jgi:VIT1/CCC1 family predicted Fe2+/Mn2+ transporter
MRHIENHRRQRIGWLRAAVLGANDGIVSTASLILGVATAQVSHAGIIIAGVAALVAGAMSMAVGEYVSVSSQSDTEQADLELERLELATDSENELKELTKIYMGRGLGASLAKQVALALTRHDALAAHARDELGIVELSRARPAQAAITSAVSFSLGAGLPLVTVLLTPYSALVPVVAGTALVFLCLLGVASAQAGGAPVLKAATRVTVLGALAMLATATVGALFNAAL